MVSSRLFLVALFTTALSGCTLLSPDGSNDRATPTTPIVNKIDGSLEFKLDPSDDPRFLFHLLSAKTGQVERIDIWSIEEEEITQRIDSSESELLEADGNAIEVLDMNFDGLNDFRFPLYRTAGPNTPFSNWLYDPASRIFVSSQALNDIPSPVFDSEQRKVRSSWRDGQTLGDDLYVYKNEQYVLIKRTTRMRDANGDCSLTEWSAESNTKLERRCDP